MLQFFGNLEFQHGSITLVRKIITQLKVCEFLTLIKYEN